MGVWGVGLRTSGYGWGPRAEGLGLGLGLGLGVGGWGYAQRLLSFGVGDTVASRHEGVGVEGVEGGWDSS